jgi:glucose dehydrogenase
MVDLRQEDDQDLDAASDIGLHAAPTVAKDVVIVGAAHTAGNVPKTIKSAKGYVRGFDVRTGKRLWIFHTIPQKCEFGYDTWLEGTDKIGHAGVWGQISVDEELNLAYLGVELPTGDTIGKYRPGDDLSVKASSRSICRPASANGITRWSITASGTMTCRAPPSFATSPSMGKRSRRWRNPPSRPSCTF